MVAGSSTAWSMASSRTDRCPATRPSVVVTMPSTRSSARLVPANTCPALSSSISSPLLSVCDIPYANSFVITFIVSVLQFYECPLFMCAVYMDGKITFSITHWGRETHICVGKSTIIGSDNGLSPGRRQAIIWTNAGILLIGPLGTNFSEILIKIITFSFKKMRSKVSSGKQRPSCLGLNVITYQQIPWHIIMLGYHQTQHLLYNSRWSTGCFKIARHCKGCVSGLELS